MSGPILTHESPIKEIPIKKKKEYSLANEINALDRQEKRNAKRLKNIKGFHNK